MRSTDELRRRLSATALVACLLACGSAAVADEPAASEAAILALVAQLDDVDFRRREQASQRLIAIGEPAVPLLLAAAKSESAEVRHRSRAIVHAVIHVDSRRRFAELARVERDEDFNLEQGLWLVARVLDPLVTRADLDRRLDELAERVRVRLRVAHGPDVDPSRVPAEAAVAALRETLFADLGFAGNEADYSNPGNSSLSQVLQTRKGLPILLSHVVVAVGRRLKQPIVGLSLPGRYLCKYDGSRAPGGPVADIVVDPFQGGRVMTLDDLKAAFPGFDPATSLKPDGRRTALIRVLTNLLNHLEQSGQSQPAAIVADYLDLLRESTPAAKPAP